MKYYLVAGEASGDLHGSALMNELKKLDPDASFRFFGGDLMEKAGGTLIRHYREMAFMGVVDVVANICTIGKNLRLCKSDILKWGPDVVVLIDSAGFNLRIAEYSKLNGFKVFYYIPPKVWAWKKSRIEKLRKFTDKIYAILPFEEEYFKKRDVEARYFGNPLMDAYHAFMKNRSPEVQFRELHGLDERPVLAILSGSRKHEVSRCLPEMLEATDEFTAYQRVIAGAPNIGSSFYKTFTGGRDVKLVEDKTYSVLSIAELAAVTSGTATLETAIFRVPQVVIYKTNPLQYEIGKHFVKIRFFSLVNLIAGREVVKELLQKNLTSEIRGEMKKIMRDLGYKKNMLNAYDEIIAKLGGPGSSVRVARDMIEEIRQ